MFLMGAASVVDTVSAAGLVKTLSDIPTLPIILNFKNSRGEAIGGELHVRVSMWKKQNVQTSEVENGTLRYDSPEYLEYVEEQNILSDDRGNGTFFLGRFSSFDVPKNLSNVYLQVEYKRQSEEEPLYILYDEDEKASGIQRLQVKTQDLLTVFKDQYERLDGYLLDKNGLPMKDPFLLRTSLWTAPTFDSLGDKLPDGTLRHISSTYVGAEVTQVLHPDAKGYFSIQIGKLASVGSLYTQKQIYLQIELKKAKDLTSGQELMKPRSGGDRYTIEAGKIMSDGQHGAAYDAGQGAVLVTQMPSGTGSTSFELGVGNKDPNAMIDLVANQGAGHNAILRFNGEKKKWQVSNDGLIFEDIATWDGFLVGTKSPRFTIGMGDLAKGKWELAFGGGDTPGILAYDGATNMFSFNGAVDFGQNQLINAVLENRSNAPKNPVKGQQYFNTVESMAYFFDGTLWQKMGGSNTSYVNISPYNNGGSPTTTIVNNVTGSSNSTTAMDYTINSGNAVGDVVLNFGTDASQYLKWKDTQNLFELGDKLRVLGNVDTGKIITLDATNTGAANDVSIVAEQGTNPNGALKYNAATGKWEISNNGGLFSAIADVSSAQTFTNKTIDGSLNTITNIPWTALSARTQTMTFSPDYPGVTVAKDGTNNKGVLSSEKDGATGKNYYEWTTSQAPLNDIDLALQVQLPEDFVSFQATPFVLEYKTLSANPAENSIDFTLSDSTNTPIALSGSTGLVSALPGAWQQAAITFTGSPTFNPGDKLFFIVKLSALAAKKAQAGSLVLYYNGR